MEPRIQYAKTSDGASIASWTLGEARSKERDDAMLSLAERDWELATETYAHTVLGWGTGQTAHEYAKFMRRSISQADYLRLRQSARQQDVSPLLPKITAPTLVVQP